MLTGGADAPIALGIVKGFILMKILTDSWNASPEKGSRPFSVNRDGFVLAEGAWMFVLEEYEHARARGAKILAEIAGYGSTCEAFHRVRLKECGEEPARAIGLAMKQAGIAPNNVDYVNLHGTSTQLNDRIETQALKLALGEQARNVADVGAEVADRASTGSVRSGWGRCHAGGHAARSDSADHQSGHAGSRVRSGLCSGGRTKSHDRTRGVQLHRVWIQELGAGAAERNIAIGRTDLLNERSKQVLPRATKNWERRFRNWRPR